MELVDVYQVLTHLLGVEPRPHNGTWATVRHMLSPAAAAGGAGGAAVLVQVALLALTALPAVILA